MNKCNGEFYVFVDARLTVAKGDKVHSCIRPEINLADEKKEVLVPYLQQIVRYIGMKFLREHVCFRGCPCQQNIDRL